MFSSLILFLLVFFSSIVCAQTQQAIEQYSNSSQWQNLLYFQGDRSIVEGERYFISPNGKLDALAELNATINAFKNNLKNKEGFLYQCNFPARFKLLSRRWPGIFIPQPCQDFLEFKRGLDIDDVYLVFTSAYTNNPASMFGHTLLRFDRKSRGTLKSTRELIGYSFAFQARTNPADNPVIYTMKGLLGGYYSYVEIKPQYINVGVYNNGESRDMWENKLNFTQEDKDLLVAHAWELSTSAAFEYYFFDENCSTYLLRLLEVIKPELEFKSKRELFVVPQVTYREIINLIGTELTQYRSSLKKRINLQFSKLNEDQQNEFFHALESETYLVKSDVKVLDTLVDYWKYKNYLEKTRLNKNEKTMMYKTLLVRSQKSEVSEKLEVEVPKDDDPSLGHKLSVLGMGGGADTVSAKLRYGFHHFSDYDQGFEKYAYINFFNLNYIESNRDDYFQLDLADILSIPDYSVLFHDLSWRGRVKYLNHDKDNGVVTTAAIGGASSGASWQYYSLFAINSFQMEHEKSIIPGLNLGLKLQLTKMLRFVMEGNVFIENYQADFENQLIWGRDSYSLSLSHRINDMINITQLELSFYL